MKPIRTTCPYCGVGCGVQVTLEKGGVSVRGDEYHPANQGRLCSKGTALAETVDLPERLRHPRIRGQRVGWEEAIGAVAGKFRQVIDRCGPEAVAFYVSGQLLTEDYYVANKLMKGFIGSANIDTNSRLCMSSPVMAHKRAFGEDCVPASYEDLSRADLVVLAGTNLAWCHPVLFRRLAEAKRENPKLYVVAIDPRRTYTADRASLHLPLKPGSDAVLFNGLLHYLHGSGCMDEIFVREHTEGLEAALAEAEASAPDIPTVARACDLPPDLVRTFYARFAASRRVVSCYSQGLNQSSSGTDKLNALLNCHLLTGRIGRKGCGPLSLTGQPNAMGGREVGGLATQLAAHMAIEDPIARERVGRFWDAPRVASEPGLKAVELFDSIASGKIKAVWIMATNPVVSLPDADQVKRALADCEFVVVSDCVGDTDTAALADVLLPAATWGEKDGTVTNSSRIVSRQRSFRTPPGEARPDWWIVSRVAKAMGYGAQFDYASPAAIFREHAALSGFENAGERQFDIGVLADLTDAEYDELEPLPWPVTVAAPRGTPRLFGDGRFPTPNGRARFVAVTPRVPARLPDNDLPFVLNTGRVRDQWHTMARTGAVPRLAGHAPEPFVEIHPDDARNLSLTEQGLAWVRGKDGKEVLMRVKLSERQRPGSLFVPMHWNGQFTGQGRVNTLVAANTDPISGQPEFKHAPAAIRPCPCAWYGFVLSRKAIHPRLRYARYWARVRAGEALWRYEAAGDAAPPEWAGRARELLGTEGDIWIEYHDTLRNQYRAAVLNGEKLEAAIFIGPDPDLPPRESLNDLFEKPVLTRDDRMRLVSGHSASGCGGERTVCACFRISEQAIRQAIEQGLTSVEDIGRQLGAGSNCGSCLPELEAWLRQSPDQGQ
ncbi:nitrate reductase [Methylohalobius crimeensis]|uniref:nitrate reductase n=1 Tax=Methylohalobius crimeensis TaxID=244365 RepID=UPI0003B6ADAA|nr:nitrate reductase [Methylohalobius crimeensis]